MVTLNTTEAQIRRVGGDFQDLIICLNFDLPYNCSFPTSREFWTQLFPKGVLSDYVMYWIWHIRHLHTTFTIVCVYFVLFIKNCIRNWAYFFWNRYMGIFEHFHLKKRDVFVTRKCNNRFFFAVQLLGPTEGGTSLLILPLKYIVKCLPKNDFSRLPAIETAIRVVSF